jgi:hypothetical protein
MAAAAADAPQSAAVPTSAFSSLFASTTGHILCSCPDPNGPHGYCPTCAAFMTPGY